LKNAESTSPGDSLSGPLAAAKRAFGASYLHEAAAKAESSAKP
jgi:hypothetical protein